MNTPPKWTEVPSKHTYEVRVKTLIAVNTAEQAGKDHDDALDAHQNVTAPEPSAEGSFGRYRQWQEQQSDLKEETVRRSQERSNEH